MSQSHPRVIVLSSLAEARRVMEALAVDAAGVRIMAPKAILRPIRLSGIKAVAGNILKQELLALGGDVALPRSAIVSTHAPVEALLLGTSAQYRRLVRKLAIQPFGLPAVARELARALAAYEGRERGALQVGSSLFRWGERTYVMGIINLGPDSFSGDGLASDDVQRTLEAALAQARRFAAEGADILDVGAESTRPGATPVSQEEEMARLLPVVERLAAEIDLPISVDTYKAEVARRAVAAGAHMINDVWALRADPAMVDVVAETGIPVALMHNQHGTRYADLMGDILRFLAESIERAEQRGVAPGRILVDPGIGFGKVPAQSIAALRHLDELKVLGKPILLGTSRKRFIGETLGLPVHDRVEGTAASVALGIRSGADMVRVHDVKQMVRVCRLTDAIVRSAADGPQEG